MQFIFLTPELIRHLWQLVTFAFRHWCLICAVLLTQPKKFCCIGLFLQVHEDIIQVPKLRGGCPLEMDRYQEKISMIIFCLLPPPLS